MQSGLVALVLILINAVAILRGEGRGHGRMSHRNNETHFYLAGTYRVPAIFNATAINDELKKTLTSIELFNVALDPPKIFLSALVGCLHLETLSLQYVTLPQKGGGFGEKRIYLPMLKNYTLSSRDPITISEKTSRLHLRDFLFFDKGNKNWKLSELQSLGTNIEILSKGNLLFKFNLDEKEIYLTYTPFVNEILTGCCSANSATNFNLDRLTIWGGDFRPANIPPTLKYLKIAFIPLSDREVSEILSRAPNLEELHLKLVLQNNRSNLVDISALSSTNSLQILQIENAYVQQSDTDTQLLGLKYLHLDNCQFSTYFLEKFNTTFANIETIQIDNAAAAEQPLDYRLLKQIFSTSVNRLKLVGIPQTMALTSESGSSAAAADAEEVEGILTKAGVVRPSAEKNIEMVKINSEWVKVVAPVENGAFEFKISAVFLGSNVLAVLFQLKNWN